MTAAAQLCIATHLAVILEVWKPTSSQPSGNRTRRPTNRLENCGRRKENHWPKFTLPASIGASAATDQPAMHWRASSQFSLRELFVVFTLASLGLATLKWTGPALCAGLAGQLSLLWLAWHAIWGHELRSRWMQMVGWSIFVVYSLSLAIALSRLS